ncbi:MAG: hypothetical protein AAGK66_08965 [Pseudomonadota bacterium]
MLDAALGLLTGLWGYLAVAAGAVVTVALAWLSGRKNGKNRQQLKDYENAADIRNRVERELPDRVRDMEGRGFRDD